MFIRLLSAALTLLPLFAHAETNDNAIQKREQDFIESVSKQHHFNAEKLSALLAKASINPAVITKMNHPFEAKPWGFYQAFFITPDRIQSGDTYWDSNQKALDKMRKRFQVSKSIVVSIIGVETRYGQRMGNYPVLSTLKTLAFAYPPRQRFFQRELTQYLLLTRKNKLDPLTLKGSYAGALGIPQFMPSSYRHYAVSLDNANTINLFNDHADAIASVGYYLKKAGWQPQAPVAVQVNLTDKALALHRKHPKARYTLSQWAAHGVIPISKRPKTSLPASLITLDGAQSKEYWLVFRNFDAILKYNHSPNYAMAVYQLSQAIQKTHQDHG